MTEDAANYSTINAYQANGFIDNESLVFEENTGRSSTLMNPLSQRSEVSQLSNASTATFRDTQVDFDQADKIIHT
jgi:hypothetical protein